MKKGHGPKAATVDTGRPPEWLEKLLRGARKSPAFRRRCERAAALAWNINHLRTANLQRAREQASLHDRVKALAATSGVQVGPVLKWFGVRTLSLADRPEAIARFGREMGFKEKDLYDHLVIGEFLAQGHRLPVAARGLLKRVVGQIERQSGTATRLRVLKEAIRDEYAEPEF